MLRPESPPVLGIDLMTSDLTSTTPHIDLVTSGLTSGPPPPYALRTFQNMSRVSLFCTPHGGVPVLCVVCARAGSLYMHGLRLRYHRAFGLPPEATRPGWGHVQGDRSEAGGSWAREGVARAGAAWIPAAQGCHRALGGQGGTGCDCAVTAVRLFGWSRAEAGIPELCPHRDRGLHTIASV